MTFPQLSSTAPVKASQEFFRLKTMLSSLGDLYESEVSGLGFAFGPDSDLATVRVSYFDPLVAGGVSQFVLSPDRNFAGRIDAHADEPYQSSPTRLGRILISIDDLYAPEWRPAGFDPNPVTGDRWEIVPPVLDVIQYFGTLPSVIPPRSDRTFRAEYLRAPPGVGKTTYVAFPGYGRKSGYFAVMNKTGATCDVHIGAVRFVFSTDPGGTVILGTETTLYPAAGLANDGVVSLPFSSSSSGTWDYFFIGLGGAVNQYNGGQMPISITLSDDVT